MDRDMLKKALEELVRLDTENRRYREILDKAGVVPSDGGGGSLVVEELRQYLEGDGQG